MGKFHLFDIDVAKKYGITAAILLYHISHWIDKNKANGKNYHDGEYWTYNSREAFLKLFPYMTDWQVRSALQTLIDNGILLVGNYNQMPYDRTKWYALSSKGKAICDNRNVDLRYSEIPLDENSSSIGEILQPIPDNKPNNKTNNISCASAAPPHDTTRGAAPAADKGCRKGRDTEVDEFFERVWALYPRKRGKGAVSKAAKKEIFKAGFDVVSGAIKKYKDEIERLHKQEEYILIGSTFFNTRWRDYVDEETDKGEEISVWQMNPKDIDEMEGTY